MVELNIYEGGICPDCNRGYSAFFHLKSKERRARSMINPVPIYLDGSSDRFCKISGYIKSVTPKEKFSYIAVKKDTNAHGVDAPLIFVKCFANEYGVNHKELVKDSKGRFVVIFAERVYYNGDYKYNAKDITICPREFTEKTHPVADDDETEYEQLSLFDFDNPDLDIMPF